ncbi:hypothetical protein PQX77_014395, partial [Marasmius sp. AFHP31]
RNPSGLNTPSDELCAKGGLGGGNYRAAAVDGGDRNDRPVGARGDDGSGAIWANESAIHSASVLLGGDLRMSRVEFLTGFLVFVT